MSSPATAPESAPGLRPNRLGLAVMTVARLVLGLGMLPYGISKLFNLQFQVGASSYAQPLGDVPTATLTWAFLGYSPAFQFLLGSLETIPAILLLFARTRRLGALLLFPVVLNVALFNHFLDLWPSTQLISAVFLALNTFLLLYDFRLYRNFLATLLAPPVPMSNRKLQLASRLAILALSAAAIAAFAFNFYSSVSTKLDPISDFIGHRQINRAGTWQIESLRISDEPVFPATGASIYFDFNHRCVYDNGARKQPGTFSADKSLHTFRLTCLSFAGTGGAIEGSYRTGSDSLILDGRRADQKVSMILRKHKWGKN